MSHFVNPFILQCMYFPLCSALHLLSPAPPGSSSEPGALVFYIILTPQKGVQHLSAEHLPPAGFLHPNADLTPSTHLTQNADQAYPRWRSWVTHARQRVLIKQAHSCQLSTRWRSRVLKTCSCKLDWCFTLSHISLFSWGTFWEQETFTQEIKSHYRTHFSIPFQQQ